MSPSIAHTIVMMVKMRGFPSGRPHRLGFLSYTLVAGEVSKTGGHQMGIPSRSKLLSTLYYFIAIIL